MNQIETMVFVNIASPGRSAFLQKYFDFPCVIPAGNTIVVGFHPYPIVRSDVSLPDLKALVDLGKCHFDTEPEFMNAAYWFLSSGFEICEEENDDDDSIADLSELPLSVIRERSDLPKRKQSQ